MRDGPAAEELLSGALVQMAAILGGGTMAYQIEDPEHIWAYRGYLECSSEEPEELEERGRSGRLLPPAPQTRSWTRSCGNGTSD